MSLFYLNAAAGKMEWMDSFHSVHEHRAIQPVGKRRWTSGSKTRRRCLHLDAKARGTEGKLFHWISSKGKHFRSANDPLRGREDKLQTERRAWPSAHLTRANIWKIERMLRTNE